MDRLPPELWLCVFLYATYVPGTLIPDVYDNASLLGPVFIKRYHPALRESLVTKRALVRVCKRWWHLALPILYQSVYIGRARCLYSLSSTLMHSAGGNNTTIASTRSLGDYTQRLDIAIRDRPKDADIECDLVEGLIRRMPHLAIFSITATANYVDTDLPYKILGALQSSANSLRVLDWSSYHLEAPVSKFSCLLDCPQLRVLSCPSLNIPSDTLHTAMPLTLTTLRSCHLLVSDAISTTHTLKHSHPDAVHPPSTLQEIILDLNEYPDEWECFFRVYGPQFISLHLRKPNNMSFDIYTPLEILAPACPNLRHLTITLVAFSDLFGHIPILPHIPITRLGLRFGVARPDKLSFRALFSFLEHVRPSMPSLRVVQLLNESNVECLLNTHTKLAVHLLRPFMKPDAQIRIEDEDGVSLTDRLKALESW